VNGNKVRIADIRRAAKRLQLVLILLKKSLLLCSKPFDSLINIETGNWAMMGTQEASKQLFYDFDLDAHVPAEHMLRQIDHFLDLDAVREQLKAYYSHLGRPSIDPQLIVRMLVIGYALFIDTYPVQIHFALSGVGS